MISASAPQAWMQYSIRLAGRNWLRLYRALGKGGRFIGYGVSAAIEGGRRNVVLVTANFTWLGLVGLVPRKFCHPVRRYAATFGDHQRVCKTSSTPEAWCRDVRFELRGVRCGLPTTREEQSQFTQRPVRIN
jgi:hypothetical protein